MSHKTVKQAWAEYVEAKNQYDWGEPEVYSDRDLGYLHDVGAHPDIIAAAEHLAGIDDFYLAAGPEIRKWAPLHMFKHSLLIADFGDGDYAVLLDARNPNSPVLEIMHDAPAVHVVANGLAALLDGLIEGLKSPTLESRGESDWGNYSEKYLDETSAVVDRAKNDQTQFGLVHESDDNFDYFDFTGARIGAAVDLRYRGRYTTIEQSDQVGVLKMGTAPDEVIRKSKRTDCLWWAGIFAYAAMIFYYFVAFKDYAIWRSLGIAVIGVLFTGLVVGMMMNTFFTIKDKFRSGD